MADNQENILVEFDYNNITIIDPNKVIDENGKAKERVVRQEDLVMYANLECKVLPRTKLAIGVSNNDQIQTISIASMNFLKPGGKVFLDNSYTDEITGKDSLTGEGVNQPNQKSISNPKRTDDYYIRQTINSGGKPGSTDNGLLGITQIRVSVNTAFNPSIEIELEDVKGRALFEAGDSSPYAAFFNMPYPLFQLTLKGFYGKAVRLPLMLRDFQSRYDASSGNFKISLKFYTYKYTALAEVSLAYLIAAPHMYKSRVGIQQTSGGPAQNTNVKEEIVEIGYQKIKELYSEYKSKGMIPDDFPEITLVQMQKRIENFIKNVLDTFTKQNLSPLNDSEEYQMILNEFQGKIFYYKGADSWFGTYCDPKNFFITNDGYKIYPLKSEIVNSKKEGLQKQSDAITKLNSIITEHNTKLRKNNTFGDNGKYSINGNEKKENIAISITDSKSLIYKNGTAPQTGDINWDETYKQLKGNNKPTEQDKIDLQAQFQKLGFFSQGISTNTSPVTGSGVEKTENNFFYFEGKNSFIDITNKMGKDLKTKREQIEKELSEALQILLESPNNGVGFVPNLRNVLAVIFANGEAFLRLMDDVHKDAWDKRLSKIRKNTILSTNTSSACSDNIDSGANEEIPIYPWPQFIVETTGENGQEKYELAYPGDPKLINQTKGFLYDEWPEVEFLEEYLQGYTERMLPPSDTTSYGNELTDINRITFNAIEFPASNGIFENKEQIKFFYEIYERLLLYSFYSKLGRVTSSSDYDKIINLISDAEKTNLVKSLGSDNPFLIQKLKQYNFNGSNFLLVLKHFSNDGTGQSWQNLIRGIFNTSYIKNYVENSEFEFLSSADIQSSYTAPLISLEKEKDLIDFLSGQTSIKEFDLTDTFPFVDNVWCKNYLANGDSITNVFDTSKVIQLNTTNKVISNFDASTKLSQKRPISNFNYVSTEVPNIQFSTDLILKEFYEDRSVNYYKQLPTEGNLRYYNYSGGVSSDQTMSILNTPYFINSIIDGVNKFQSFDEHPYVSSAYLFLNSLPLATLREKYKDQNDTELTSQNSATDLDYIFATLKKFGAIHKVPYAWVLKIGSVYHRYKKYIETGVDILDTSWSGFSYVNSFDPVTSSNSKTYYLTINGGNIDITLQQNTPVGTEVSTLINTGFYPKLINDFNLFYQGYYPINPYLSISGSGYITDTTLVVTNISSNNLQVGSILFGGNIAANTTIVSQINGTPGGVGSYVIDISQTAINGSTFEVSNSSIPGYTDFDIQTAISSGLTFNYVDQSIINLPEGFDLSKPNRDLRIIPWSMTMNTLDGKYSYILPSNGFITNQTLYECFSAATNNPPGYNLTNEVTGNTAVFDGSVRLFWAAPNYGYFDTTKVTKPSPYEYMKLVFSGENQENFSINGTNIGYSKISEMFSVFEKDILDKFEDMFLNFSKSIYDYDSANLSGETNLTQDSFMNFQMFFRSLMKIPIQTGTTGEDVVKNIISTQTEKIRTNIKSFLEYDIIFKYGNPSNYDRRLFGTFATPTITDSYTWEPYSVLTPNALPPAVTLLTSKVNYPNPWKTLETYLGFSEQSGFTYSNNGSYITDFFIDNNVAFTSENIKNLYPIIRIYATQKSLGNVTGSTSFNSLITEYINGVNKFQTDVSNSLFIKIQKELPNVKSNAEAIQTSVLQGDQNKLELWETFKAFNDRWIAGTDFKTKTLFEDVLLLDRAGRNIGEKILVDIFKLRDRLMNIPEKASMLSFVQTIIQENNFVIMNIPSYVNFYNVQDATKNPIPKPEGTLEIANTLFGTHLNVDYRNTTSKMVCFYAGKPSEHLDIKSVDYRFRGDAFDLRRASDNPLVENQIDKKDWDKSNKVVGFNVDIGPQNQSIFHGFFVDQRAGTPTAEGLEILNQMANQGGNRGGATQSVSLYNLYKNRSYNCTVSMLGNALIQPTMYFNLRHVPMFSGPYMILSVNHVITPGQFETTFTGVRQPLHNLPLPNSYLQSLRTNLLQSLVTLSKQEKDTTNKITTTNQSNVINQSTNAVNGLTSSKVSTQNNTQTCTASTAYSTFVAQTPVNLSSINQTKLATIIKGSTSNTALRYTIFTKIYLSSKDNQNFKAYENNFAAISLDVTSKGNPMNWGEIGNKYFTQKKFYCSSNQIPYVYFNSVQDSVNFLVERWAPKIGQVEVSTESITKFLFLNQTSETADNNIYTSAKETDIMNIRYYVQEAINIWNIIGK